MKHFFGYRSFMPEYETMKRFASIGVDTVTLMLSNGYTASGHPYTKFQPIWTNDHEYDLDMVRRILDEALEAVPKSRIILYIDLNTPIWWHRRKADRCDSFYQLGMICADPEWIQDTSDYFTAVLTLLEKEYGEHIDAYIYTGGGTTEWFDRSYGVESYSKLRAYQRWCEQKGLPVAQEIPSYTKRFACTGGTEPLKANERKMDGMGNIRGSYLNNGQGLLMIPEENPEGCQYWKFCNELIADTVIHFAKVARQVIRPEIPLGTTFGYNVGVQTPRFTQNDYLRVFDCPEIDFFLSPIGYYDRGMGGGSGGMIPHGSLKLRGKGLLNSCDARTYTSRNLRSYDKNQTFWKTDAEVTAGIRREASMNLINGSSTWWFDMMGGWWDSQAAMDTLKKARQIWDEYAALPRQENYELFIISQPKNLHLLNVGNKAADSFFSKAHVAANRAGIPYEFGAIEDIELLDTERVKIYVFQQPFVLADDELALLKRKVFRNGNMVIWLYGPGVIKDGKWNEANVEAICGTPFNTPGVSVKQMDGWTSVYIHDPDDLTPEVLFDLVRQTKAHIWCEQPLPVRANDLFASLHTAGMESITFRFPKKCRLIIEMFTGQQWKDVQELHLSAAEPMSWLFKYE